MSGIAIVAQQLTNHKELAVLQILAPFEAPIIIAGAYYGDTIDAVRQFDSNVIIHAFEPQECCRASLLERMARDENLYCHFLALGIYDGKAWLHGPGNDFASLVSSHQAGEEEVTIVEANRTLKGIERNYSLAIINMEGYEYVLLPHLDVPIENYLVQFHPKVAGDLTYKFLPGYDVMWDNYPSWIWWSKTWHR